MSLDGVATGCSAARAAAADAAISERAARLSAVGSAAASSEYATRSCNRAWLISSPIVCNVPKLSRATTWSTRSLKWAAKDRLSSRCTSARHGQRRHEPSLDRTCCALCLAAHSRSARSVLTSRLAHCSLRYLTARRVHALETLEVRDAGRSTQSWLHNRWNKPS